MCERWLPDTCTHRSLARTTQLLTLTCAIVALQVPMMVRNMLSFCNSSTLAATSNHPVPSNSWRCETSLLSRITSFSNSGRDLPSTNRRWRAHAHLLLHRGAEPHDAAGRMACEGDGRLVHAPPQESVHQPRHQPRRTTFGAGLSCCIVQGRESLRVAGDGRCAVSQEGYGGFKTQTAGG